MIPCVFRSLPAVHPRTFFGAMMICAGVAASAFSSAFAAQFELVKGDHYQLCRDLQENLRRFPDLPERPMQLPLHADFKDFKPVAWESLDPLEHVDSLREIMLRQKDRLGRKTREEQEADWKAAELDLLSRAKSGDIELGKARMDINHDGEVETVYRYGYFKWPAMYPEPHDTFAWTYHILEKDQLKASNQLRRHSGKPFDAFWYRGRVYLYMPGGIGFSVFEPTEARTDGPLALIHICRFYPP